MSCTPIVLAFSALSLITVSVHAEQKSPYVPEFQCDQGKYGLSLPAKLTAVMRLESITKEDVLSVEKWEGYTSTRKHVYFSGLTLGLITFSNDPDKYMVSSAEIASSKWAHIAPFRVGDSVSSIRRKIGSFANNDPLLKASYGSEGGDLSFEVSNGKVTKIIYACYTG